MESRTHQDRVTESVRDHIHKHLPYEVKGYIGDKIRDSLKEVREFHWKDDALLTETWAYELEFSLEGEVLVLQKSFSLDQIVTATRGFMVPYSEILCCLLLTDNEVAVLATAI